VTYPNSRLANSVISNFTFEKKPVRVRVRFQVGYDADLPAVRKLTLEAIDGVPGIIPGTGALLVRSLWDDSRGHLMSGVLLEARYRLEDVRKRSEVRSIVLERVLSTLQRNGVPFAAHPVLVTGRPNQA